MFTGIIKDIGKVESVDASRGDTRLVIKTGLDLASVELGASIACSGCCLTVVEKGSDSFAADVSAETLSKTTIGDWQEGTKVNLEAALRMGDEMGGHIVSGHVDGQAIIESITKDGDSHIFKIKAPDNLAQFIAPKGSVAIDGVSLTINAVQECVFDVNIIPYTFENTALCGKGPGDAVNLEVDMLARYAARILER